MREGEREAFRLHARLPAFRSRVAVAASLIRQALAEQPGIWAVAVSGGKDSTALADLAWGEGWRGPLFHFRFREHPAVNTALVHLLADRIGAPVIDVLVPGDFDVYEEIGHFFAVPETPEEIAAVRAGERRYKAAVEAAAREAGLTGLFWGMRAEESRARAFVVARQGILYRAAARRSWTSLPLARWSGRDVWAYLVRQDLPWLPVYDDSEQGRERERSETTWLGFPELWRRGQGRRLRERDPALWSDLTARWPELARWG